MTTLAGFRRHAMGCAVAAFVALTSCGGREGASPALPSLVAGDAHSVAIKADGTLWAWGHNASGEIGNGTRIDSRTPIQIGNDRGWLSAAAGTRHTVAAKTDGTLWAWGLNEDGQPGNGTNENVDTPIQTGR